MKIGSKKFGRKVAADVDKAVSDIIKSAPKPEVKDDGAELKAAVAPKKAETFAEAFRRNRAEKGAGQTFTWNGKSFTTNMAGEGAKRPVAGRASAMPTRRANATPSGSKSQTTTTSVSTPKAKEAPKVNIDNRFISRSGTAPLRAKVEEKPAPRPSDKSQSQRYNARAAELTREANAERMAEKAKGSAGARARFKNMFGFGSDAAERAAKNYARMAEGAGRQERAIAAKPKSPPLLLVGEEAREANRRDGTIGGMAKGGKVRSIDGCAVRGKTRAMRKK